MKTLPQYISSINEWVLNKDSDVDISKSDFKKNPELCLRVQLESFKKHEKEILNAALKNAKLTPDDILHEMEGKFKDLDEQWKAYDNGSTENYIKLEFKLNDYLRNNHGRYNIPMLHSVVGRDKIHDFDKILEYMFNNVVEIMHNLK